MGEAKVEFTSDVDGGDLGQIDLDVLAEVEWWDSGEDFDCSATIVSATVPGTGHDVLGSLSEEAREKLEQRACEQFVHAPVRDQPKRGPSRWRDSGKPVEVLGWVDRPEWLEWYLLLRVSRETLSEVLREGGEPRYDLISQEEAQDEHGRFKFLTEEQWRWRAKRVEQGGCRECGRLSPEEAPSQEFGWEDCPTRCGTENVGDLA